MLNCNDRGSKRWTAMMLPEHIKMLREWENHLKTTEKKPILDEQKLYEMNEIISISLNENLDVVVEYYNANHKESFLGEVLSVDTLNHRIKCITHDGTTKTISLGDIINIRLN